MKNIIIIFLKEMKDILRDRRTLLLMVVMPLVLFPLIINISSKFMMKLETSAKTRILKVGVILNSNENRIRRSVISRDDMTLTDVKDENSIESMINGKTLDFCIVFDELFDKKVKALQQGEIRLYFKSSAKNDISKRRIDKLLSDYKNDLLEERFRILELSIDVVKAFNINEKDIVTVKEKFGEKVGGFIPYLFVIFCFVGAMYPAIDLGAGEKERGTIETLLVSPATRSQIVIGKFIVVALSGIISAVLTFVGLYASIKLNSEIPTEILDLILKVIDINSIIVIITLIIPISVFFAGILLSFSFFANSFKEAQSIMTPLNFVVIIPAFIGTLPGMKLTATTAMIPILNVSLASKGIISGTINNGHLAIVYISMFLLAAVSLFICIKWFGREQVIFRG